MKHESCKVSQVIRLKVLFSLVMLLMVVLAPTLYAKADMDLSADAVYQAMMAKQTEYPEGMPWTNADTYNWYAFKEYSVYYTGGCAAFAAILSDAAFGDLPARQLNEKFFDAIRPGDILRFRDGLPTEHSVIVLKKYDDHVVVAEGNYNSSIHWGREMTKTEIDGGELSYIITRYPTDPIEHHYELYSKNGNQVTLKCSDCGLKKVLTIPGSDTLLYYMKGTVGWYPYSGETWNLEKGGIVYTYSFFVKPGGSLQSVQFDAETVSCEIADGTVAQFTDGTTYVQSKSMGVQAVGSGSTTLTIRSIYDDNKVLFTVNIHVSGIPKLKGTVTISGETMVGETLTASIADTNNTGTLKYEWWRSFDDQNLTKIGEGLTYQLKDAEIGARIFLRVSSSVEEDFLWQQTATLVEKKAEPALFKLAGASMNLGNSLDMLFLINKTDITETDCYATITKKNANKADTVKTYQFSEWYTYGPYYLLQYDKLTAMEMNDMFYVQVFHKDGTPASECYEDSVADYALRGFDELPEAEKRLSADLLFYGAAAQKTFGYDMEHLVSDRMTDAQKAYGTVSVSGENKKEDKTYPHYAGTSLDLQSRIQFYLFFNDIPHDGYAKISFTNHNGTKVESTVAGSDYLVASATMSVIAVNELTIPDARKLVTCEVYDKDGNLLDSVTDSIESYVFRGTTGEIDEAVLKFADSAYNYFHP
ncbi:MAG: hypothetical protein IKO03_00875 [Lachnospiraceae bacterium]|nr:hypothetical protein [Lachnospiraceae bacterium]